jgi:glycosyltransferase involved in cell wall biosynthesis
MSVTPKASFILPAYKRRFLHEAIRSILDQTERDFELVVVDDASPENLKEVVDSFRDSRLGYQRNEANIGGQDLVAAWNHAMTFARAEWCILASDDDIYLPGFLEEMFRLQAKHPRCDLFHCRTVLVDAAGEWLRLGHQRVEFESQAEFAYSRLMLHAEQMAPDFMFRRAALVEMGGFVNFPLAWQSDDATWMAMARNGCVCSPQVLFQFRLSGANVTATSDATVEGKLKAKVLFRIWLHDFIKDLQATNDFERFLREKIAANIDPVIEQEMAVHIGEVESFRKWCRILRKTPIPGRLKMQCLYRRFKLSSICRKFLPKRPD